MHIILDCSGSEASPQAELTAVKQIHLENPEYTFTLLGNSADIELLTDKLNPCYYDVVDCPDVIFMHDKVSDVIRTKQSSALAIGHKLLAKRTDAVFISCGHTGAHLAFASLNIPKYNELSRAGIGALFPHPKGQSFLIDVGSNIETKLIHFIDYARMSHIYLKYVHSVSHPKIAILNVGEEKNKGDKLRQDLYLEMETSDLNFIGNIEGHELLSGKSDIILCDGFTGNIILKFMESFFDTLRESAGKQLAEFKKYDYQQHGGVPILGIQGTSFICHGRSSAEAIATAIRSALKFHQSPFHQIMSEYPALNK